jgi:hypothetical protein
MISLGLTFLMSTDMNRKFMFETMVNVLIVHNYTISYVDELLLSQKIGD